MNYATHVYLGPTLEVAQATKLLKEAHYHPPIKCGDLIRLLRLNPKRVIIIDGIYETIPAVWHKEILLLLDLGVEVYGAASMGALRAAELHQFGMIGKGEIFQLFADNILNDDDEVAVLHRGSADNYSAINDALVNIRATLTQAHQQNIITLEIQESLIAWCKKQFYAHRSLKKALQNLANQYPDDGALLLDWFAEHGLIDLKRKDAEHMLTYVAQLPHTPPIKSPPKMPVTKFIASLVDEAVFEPFDFQAEWLPEMEQNLQTLSIQHPLDFKLVKELGKLIKYLYSVTPIKAEARPVDLMLAQIKAKDFYSPEEDFNFIKNHPILCDTYPLLCSLIYKGQISEQMIQTYLPALEIYIQNDNDFLTLNHLKLVRLILVLIFCIHTQLDDHRLKMKESWVLAHLKDIDFWTHVDQALSAKTKKVNSHTVIELIAIYMQMTFIHHGFRDIKPGTPATPAHFNWLYYGYDFYKAAIV